MYSTLIFAIRKYLGVSVIEYHILDIVHNLSNRNINWAYISKQKLADHLGISRRSIINAINNLEKSGLLIRHIETKHLKTSETYNELMAIDGKYSLTIVSSENIAHPVQKLHTPSENIAQLGVKKLHTPCEKTSHNKENYKETYKEINNAKEIFNSFRNEYRKLLGGTVNGLETEFKNFTKKYSDWEKLLPELSKGLEREKQHRDFLKEKERFVPEPKNLKTWINNRCWETEYAETEQPKSQVTREQLEREEREEAERRRELSRRLWEKSLAAKGLTNAIN